MATCASCGTNNIEGTKFCVSCGATLAPHRPPPESWRMSGDLNNQPPPATPYNPTGGYTPQTPPPNYPSYNAGQNMTPSYQQQRRRGISPCTRPSPPSSVSSSRHRSALRAEQGQPRSGSLRRYVALTSSVVLAS
jgi:hypothetical protein